ncbi:MAG TPA: O-antigen ligase family protein [Candidatus Bathyarchaeia archaeon]|nr:O-antigen ligase family protein [Candidatus Bathyarchaeia archaeon]
MALLVVCVAFPPEVHGLALAAMAILALLAVVASPAMTSPASYGVWAAVPVVLVASRLGIAPGEAVEPAATMLLAALAGIAASGIAIPVDLLAKLFGAAVAVVSSRALYEWMWGLSSWAERVRAEMPAADSAAILNRLEQGRPYGGFVTPAALGCFLAMTVPAVAAWALGKRGSARAFGVSVAALGAAALLTTRSVTALAALAGAVMLAGLRGRIPRRVLVGTALTIGLAATAIGIARPDAVLAPGSQDSPWSLRAGNVRVALEIARAHPLFGVGPGGYAEAFPQYRRAGDNESRHAHDLPAELMAEWGIPAGLLLSALFFWLFVAPVVRASGSFRSFPFGLSIGLAAFALHNVVDFTSFLPSLLVLAAVTRGWLAARPIAPPAAPRWLVATLVLTGGLAVVVAGAGFAREAVFDARRSAATGDHIRALADASRARRAAPWDADPPQLEAEARMAAGGDLAAALAAADRAVARAPARAAARAVRARARAAAGDAAGAYADLVEASRLYPTSPDYAPGRDALEDALAKARAGAPR